MHKDVAQTLFTAEEIRAAIARVADELSRDYADGDLVVLGVLKGSCVFVADLIRALEVPLELAFVGASSYGSGTTAGELTLNFFPQDEEIRGRRVLLVDDILDTGRTMAALSAELLARGAAEVRTCAFLDKPSRRVSELDADYRCFEVGDHFVVGYGLDFAGRYRNLPFVGVLREDVVEAGLRAAGATGC